MSLATVMEQVEGRVDPAHLEALETLADWVARTPEPALVFVCTHNSRRSHMAQLWAWAAAEHRGLPVRCFSAGTEATAFHPHAVRAMREVGFRVEAVATPEVNPVYATSLGSCGPVASFSKTLGHGSLPTEGFAAVMVCSSADESCPVVFGADVRISLPFDDPKDSDGTPEEATTYRARSLAIGREMAFVMARAAGAT
ncbi:MAG: hypothetical protein KTR31_14495 [Myxococcales bacterium]|nr:hypothetical protein [Myxococcales bacterium]